QEEGGEKAGCGCGRGDEEEEEEPRCPEYRRRGHCQQSGGEADPRPLECGVVHATGIGAGLRKHSLVQGQSRPYTGRVAAALAAQALAKRYGRVDALHGVDLEVAEGELVGLLGPNGAGKSTLVKIACGLVRPTSGKAWVSGARAGSAQARASLGYLAELFRFPAWLSPDDLLHLHQHPPASPPGTAQPTP